MKRAFLFAMALMLAASTCFAAAKPVAVFYQTTGNPIGTQNGATTIPMELGGWNVVPFNANVRNWGQSGMDDIDWFAERFAAAIVLQEDGQASGVPVVGGPYGTNFLNAAGTPLVAQSPLSGRWKIPTFVHSTKSLVPTNSYDDTTANRYVAGITPASPAGAFFKPALAAAGTWRYRFVVRRFEGRLDTLYGDAMLMGCRPNTWPGAGSVAAIAWVDSGIATGFGSCVANDTPMVMWRFRPRGDRPGVYYSTFRCDWTGGYNIGALMFLQYIATITEAGPQFPIAVPFMEHDIEPVDETNAAHRASLSAVHTSLRSKNSFRPAIARTYNSPIHPTEYGAFYNAASLAIVRRGLLDDLCNWHPFSYASSSGATWDFFYYTAADTAGVRRRWNSLANTGASPDSFDFPRDRYSAARVVSSSGEVGAWMGRVLADGGCRIIESTYALPKATGQLVFQVGANGYGQGITGYVLGAGEARTITVQGTYGFLHNNTFTGLCTVNGFGQEQFAMVGAVWINTIGVASTRRTSIYWHTGGGSGVAAADPYFSWLVDVAARHFGYFDKIIQPDNGFVNQNATPRGKFTPRF